MESVPEENIFEPVDTTSTDGTDDNQNCVDVIINENNGHELNNGLEDNEVEEVEIEEQNV